MPSLASGTKNQNSTWYMHPVLTINKCTFYRKPKIREKHFLGELYKVLKICEKQFTETVDSHKLALNSPRRAQ